MTSLTATVRLGRHRAHAHAVAAPATVPVTIAPSWALGIVLTAWTLGDALLPDAVPDRSLIAYAATAVATAAVFAMTLALHEAAHALAAYRLGLEVRGITLSWLGGKLELSHPPASPRAEARVAMAGPLASTLMAVVATLLHIACVVAELDPLFGASAAAVAIANMLVAIVNCVPALPLDGGYVLHAIAWRLTGRQSVGVRLFAGAGRALGVTLVALAVVASAAADTAVAMWLALLGFSVRA